MNTELKQQFPKWTTELSEDKDFLILSDDLDSLFSCAILNKLFGVKVKGFYNFYNLYLADEKEKLRHQSAIGVDTDFTRLKCFGNHLTNNNNNKCANLNNIFNIKTSNYTDKFAGSTLLTILSLYDMHDWVNSLSEEAQMVLLCVDSSFLGYFYNGHIQYIHKKWFTRLGFENLYNLIKTKNKSDFEKINRKYNLKGKITYLQDTKLLYTDIDIVALEELFNLNLRINLCNLKFNKIKEYHNCVMEDFTQEDLEQLKNDKDITSLAITSKRKLKYTSK